MTKRLQGGSEIVTDDAASLVSSSSRLRSPTRRVLSLKGLQQPGHFSRDAETRALTLFQHQDSGPR